MATNPEKLLLSAVLKERDHVTPMARGITAELFHVHHDEWKWVERYISRRRRTPSIAAFKAKFPDFSIKDVDDVEHYIEEVKQSHIRFCMIQIMDQTATQIEQDSDMTSAVQGMHKSVVKLQSDLIGRGDDSDIISSWQTIYDEISDKAARVDALGQAGIPTGFDTLDQVTGGPNPGEYWVVAARLGQGKTWTGVRMAVAAAFAGKTVQYFSLEQSRTQIALRVHAFMANEHGKSLFKHMDLQQGKNFSLIDYKRFLRKLDRHLPVKFHVEDNSRGRVSALTIAAQIELNQPDIVFVDYLTLMDKPGDDWLAVAELSSDIKVLAQRYQVPIVALAQINRVGSGKEPPGPEHLAQSDRIGQDADCIVTLVKQSPHVVKMRLAKYRHGQDGMTWYTQFSPNSGQFDEITGDDAHELMEHDLDDEED